MYNNQAFINQELYRNWYWIMILTDTAVSEIEDTFKRFIKRDDIDIILINQNVSNEIIKKYIYNYTETG